MSQTPSQSPTSAQGYITPQGRSPARVLPPPPRKKLHYSLPIPGPVPMPMFEPTINNSNQPALTLYQQYSLSRHQP